MHTYAGNLLEYTYIAVDRDSLFQCLVLFSPVASRLLFNSLSVQTCPIGLTSLIPVYTNLTALRTQDKYCQAGLVSLLQHSSISRLVDSPPRYMFGHNTCRQRIRTTQLSIIYLVRFYSLPNYILN